MASHMSHFISPGPVHERPEKTIGVSLRDALEFKAHGPGSKLNFSDSVQPVAFRRFQLCKRTLQPCHTRRQPRLATRNLTRRSTLFWPGITRIPSLSSALIPSRAIKLRPEGFFEATWPSSQSGPPAPAAYKIRGRTHFGEPFEIYDPYAFPCVLTEFDLHLMGEGRHYDTYEKLGAHVIALEGVRGVQFAVWAPSARRVSVVGDFNRSTRQRTPPQSRSLRFQLRATPADRLRRRPPG